MEKLTISQIKYLLGKVNEDIFSGKYDLNETQSLDEIAAKLRFAISLSSPKTPIDDNAFGKCPHCNYVFNSELISEYEIKHCPDCGQRIAY